jgi:hypothetical protein
MVVALAAARESQSWMPAATRLHCLSLDRNGQVGLLAG